MKKVYIFLMSVLCIFVVNAQVFKLSYLYFDGEEHEFTDLVNVLLDPEESINATWIHFENISGADLNYKIQLTNAALANGASCQMCFAGECLVVDISPVQSVAAGAKVTDFDLSYMYENTNVSRLTVNILSEENEVLQSFNVTYSQTLEQLVSLDEVGKGVSLSLSASPIPATTNTTIRYAVPSQYKKADIIIRNTLGSVVAKYNVVTGKKGKIDLNVSDFNSGIYFYSIIADGRVLSTKKLVVKH